MESFETTQKERKVVLNRRKRHLLLFKCQLLVLFQFLKGCDGIHLEAVLVPQSKFRGQNATLLCKYELEPNEELFSLKWYKEETEFYRYTPPDPLSSVQNPSPVPSPKSFRNNFREATPDDDEEEGQNNNQEVWSINNGRRSWHQQYQGQDEDVYQQTDHKGPPGHQMIPDKPQGLVQTWNVPGIKIDERASTPQRVVLKKVGFKSTGMYRCEVTAVVKQRGYNGGYHGIQEFVMKESINRMTVVELPGPSSNPIITGGEVGGTLDKRMKQIYKPGDLLNLTCTSAPSNPPATLEWMINGNKVDSENVVQQHLIDRRRGLFSSTIGLLLKLKEKHFDQQGQLRVLCRGTIEAEFWKKDVENVYNVKDSFVKVLEIKESQWPDSSSKTLVSVLLMATMFILSSLLS